MNETAVFDVTRPIALKLNTPDGVKTVRVRFPTDEEWNERQRRRKIIIKSLGRGKSETTVSGGEDADLALLEKIRLEDDSCVEVDQYEASRSVEQLSQAEVDDVVHLSGSFRVTTRVLGATTTHLLRTPSAKDVIDYRRSFARVIDLPYGRQEVTINMAAAAALYKKTCEATERYAGAVPVIHQAVAVKAAIDALDEVLEDSDPN